ANLAASTEGVNRFLLSRFLTAVCETNKNAPTFLRGACVLLMQSPTRDMESPLYIRVRGRVLGPYKLEKLKGLARRGQLSRMHELSTDGISWVRASNYPELFTGGLQTELPDLSGGKQVSHDVGETASDPEVAGDYQPVSSPPPVSGGSPAAWPTNFCYACGSQIDARAEICPRCGVRQQNQQGTTVPTQHHDGPKRLAACLLALFLGMLGAHKFYLGEITMGLIYLLCGTIGWALIFPPMIIAVVSLIEGIMYLAQSDADFASKYARQ
ncbi:MAG: NINE protein, partial [Candidatus Sulfotelmatobacter sp.]